MPREYTEDVEVDLDLIQYGLKKGAGIFERKEARCALCSLINGSYSSGCEHCKLGFRSGLEYDEDTEEDTNCLKLTLLGFGLK